MSSDSNNGVLEVAVRMLARREHSVHELRHKLIAKGFDRRLVEDAVTQCRSKNLVSDARFVEALIHERKRRGYGPLRIQNDLRQRGIDAGLVADWLDVNDPGWLASLREVRCKKFGNQPPDDYREWARQARFLQSRGFSADQIRQVMNGVES